MHKDKSAGHRKKNSGREEGGFSSALKNSLFGTAYALIISLVLAFISAVICYSNKDPDSITVPLSLASLYIGALAGGFISVRKNKGGALLCGILCGIFLSVFYIIFSFIFKDSHAVTSSFPASLGLRLLTVLFSIFGGYLGLNIKKSGKPKKKKR